MEAQKRVPGRAFCPKCGQKYAVPEERLKRHPGLRFRATCRVCNTAFSVRWHDDGLETDIEEILETEADEDTRNVLAKGARIGKYEVEEALASGGSSTVYRAFELGANRTVALKVLHQAPDSEYGFRFRREVEVQGNLKHQNLMPIFDQGTVSGKPYYTMELLHKPTPLETVVGLFRANRLGYNPALRTLNSLEAMIRRVVLPVARAITFANQNGIIHRDLKPNNVIIDARTLRVYVIDFGICHLFRKTGQRLVLRAGEGELPEQKRMAMGTVRFMPPEQARGDVSEQGDVWALAALLYYVVAGDAPVLPAVDLRRVSLDKRVANLRKIAASCRASGDEEEAAFYEKRAEELNSGGMRSFKDMLRDAQEGNYVPLPAGVDIALAAIIRRGMAPEPDARYPTAAEFADDLQRWLDGRPVRAYAGSLGAPKAALYQARLFARRNRTPLAVAAGALVLGFAFVVFQFFRESSERERNVAAWVAQARESKDPARQEDLLTRALVVQPKHAEAERLLRLARKFGPLREKIDEAWAVRKKVGELRRQGQTEAAEQLAEDSAAVLAGSVLPDLESLPKDYPGRKAITEARQLADYLGGQRMVRVESIPDGAAVAIIPPVSRANPTLRWDDPIRWGTAPLPFQERPLETGSYVLVVSRGENAVCVPFVLSHSTPPQCAVVCPMDPAALPDGMVLVLGDPRYVVGDLRFLETTETIRLEPFFLDIHEVTNAEYARFLDALDEGRARAAVPRRLLDASGLRDAPLWTPDAQGQWRYPDGTAAEPVLGISLLDARAYASWAKKRLPTAEEWERAARGVDGRDYPFGNALAPGACNAHTGAVAQVGRHPLDRSPFGVFDLGGNVAEWTRSTGALATIKGGSYDLPRFRAIATSSTRRRAELPYLDVGFRCARDLPEALVKALGSR